MQTATENSALHFSLFITICHSLSWLYNVFGFCWCFLCFVFCLVLFVYLFIGVFFGASGFYVLTFVVGAAIA